MSKPYLLPLLVGILLLPCILFAQTWKPLGFDQNNNPNISYAYYTKIAVGSNNIPYIAFNDDTHEGRITVKKLDGANWIAVGRPGFSEGYTNYIDMAFAPDGALYVSYTVDDIRHNLVLLIVRKLIGSTWVKVGEQAGFGIGGNLAFAPDSTPYIAYEDLHATTRGITVKKFTNGDWQYVGSDSFNTITGSSTYSKNGGTLYFHGDKLVIDKNGALYLGYATIGTNFKASVKKFVNDRWEFVGDADFTPEGTSEIALAMSSTGILYIGYRDSLNNKKATVRQFKNGKWWFTDTTSLSKGNSSFLDLALAPDETPYLVFRDGSKQQTTVKKLINSKWVSEGQGDISILSTRADHIAIGRNAIPYVIYCDSTLYTKIVVKKLDDDKWVGVGQGGISYQSASVTVAKTSAQNVTFVAFDDKLYGGRLSVKKYQSGSWQYVGQPGISAAAINSVVFNRPGLTITATGTPYVIYQDTSGHKNGIAIVKKFDGSNWVNVGEQISYYSAIPKLEIAPNGNIYLLQAPEQQGEAFLIKQLINNSWIQVWQAKYSVNFINNLSFSFDSQSIPYVLYAEGIAQRTPRVRKLVGDTWIALDDSYFGSTRVDNICIKVSNDDIPYIAYPDIGVDGLNARKITVRRFVNNTWAEVGGQTVSGINSTEPQLFFDINGAAYLNYLEGNTVDVVKKLVQDKWVDAGSKIIKPSGAFNSFDHVLTATTSGDLIYIYLAPEVYARILTSDDLPATPVIYTCSPNAGGPGTVAVINGINLGKTTSVKFGQTEASSFNIVSGTQINAIIGSGSSGLVTLTTSYGSTTFDGFTYSPMPPVITSFTPKAGPVGSTVNINGKNFGSAVSTNTVFFGAVKATILAAKNDMVQVKVPSGGSYQPITLTTNNMTAYAQNSFDISFDKVNPAFDSLSFAAKKDYPTLEEPTNVEIADLNNDGLPEILAGAAVGRVSLYKNSSTAKAIIFNNTSTNPAIPYVAKQIATADFDGDGKKDVVLVDGEIVLFKNSSAAGEVTFVGPAPYNSKNYTAEAIGVGDIDGDGRPDVVTHDNTVLRNYTTLNDYNYLEDVAPFYNTDEFLPGSIAVADLDGDGLPEIVSTTAISDYPAEISIFKNNSSPHTISFAAAAKLIGGKYSKKVVIADINGDNKPDIIIPCTGSNIVTIYKNLSSVDKITFAPGVDFATGNGPISVCIADLDGDQKPDMAVSNSNDNTISVYKNTGDINNISFASKVSYKTGKSPQGIAINDLDGDGAPELVVTNLIDNTISIFRNNLITETIADKITFDLPQFIIYGAPDFSFSGTSTDKTIPVTYTSSDTSILKILPTGMAHVVQTGQLIITAQQTGGTASPVAHHLQISAAKVVVTADDKTKVQSTDNPVLTMHFKGFVNGDDSTQTLFYPTITTTADKNSPVGEYPITVSGGSYLNYYLTYVSGTLTVDSVPVIIPPTDTTHVFPVLQVSKALSPNGDAKNEFLNITGITDYPDNHVVIANRDGIKIFEISGYDNQEKVFDGHSNITGVYQQQGTYFYLIDYKQNGKKVRKTGYFVLKY
jgi:gliding motility-associated-like protein